MLSVVWRIGVAIVERGRMTRRRREKKRVMVYLLHGGAFELVVWKRFAVEEKEDVEGVLMMLIVGSLRYISWPLMRKS